MQQVFQSTEKARRCAANLCDLLLPTISVLPLGQAQAEIDRIVSAASAQAGREVGLLYVGSYFCDRYFCRLGFEGIARVAAYARGLDLALTLVVPIFGQQTLERGERIVVECVKRLSGEGGPLDELCVNDYGEAAFAAELLAGHEGLRLCWGRLFAKALRDPRYASFAEGPQRVPYDRASIERIKNRFGASLFELDPFAPELSLEDAGGAAPYALHLPHSYMTTGHVCEFASLARPTSQKFRADCGCLCECLQTLSVYETQDETGYPLFFSKQGRTVYFENPNCAVDNPAAAERIIWTPDDFNCPHEFPWPLRSADWPGGGWQWA